MPAHIVGADAKKERGLYGMLGKDPAQIRHAELCASECINVDPQTCFHYTFICSGFFVA